MIAHPTIPWCWVTSNRAQLLRSMALNSPALVFCDSIAELSEAVQEITLAGIEPVVVPIEDIRMDPRCIALAIQYGSKKHARAVILGRGMITGWYTTAMRCVVMWNSARWTTAEIQQAHGRIRQANIGFTRTFIYEDEL